MEDQAKGFLARLFDFSFNTFVTPTIVSIIYGLMVLIAAISAIGGIIRSFGGNVLTIIGSIIFAPIAFILLVLFFRIWLEVIIVIFKIAEDLHDINRRGGGM